MAFENLVRQRHLVPSEIITSLPGLVVGVGASGRNLVVQLAAMGMNHFHLVDPDHVDATNVASQGYRQSDIGEPKVSALADYLKDYRQGIEVQTTHGPFSNAHLSGDISRGVVFVCVDSMSVRRAVWDAIRGLPLLDRPRLLIEGRIGGDLFRVLTVDPQSEDESRHYESTLYSDDEAIDTGCAGDMTMYVAAAEAAFKCNQLSIAMRKWVAPSGGFADHYELDLQLNMRNNDLTNHQVREDRLAALLS